MGKTTIFINGVCPHGISDMGRECKACGPLAIDVPSMIAAGYEERLAAERKATAGLREEIIVLKEQLASCNAPLYSRRMLKSELNEAHKRIADLEATRAQPQTMQTMQDITNRMRTARERAESLSATLRKIGPEETWEIEFRAIAVVIQEAIDEARGAEREECAQVADDYANETMSIDYAMSCGGHNVAERIRARTEVSPQPHAVCTMVNDRCTVPGCKRS
jgi:hypothetical protein